MRKSRDIKVREYGVIWSGVFLLLLVVGLVCPVAPTGVWAEEDAGLVEDVSREPAGSDATLPAAQADLINSTVSFAFGEPVGVSSLTPISGNGASALYSVQATVDVTNSGGYTVYLGSSKSELTGKNSGATIKGVTGSSTYEELPLNTWGYNANEGETAGTTFSAMPAHVRGVVVGANDSASIKAESRTFTLSFAAHIGDDKPADTYENQVTMSVVSSPLEVTGLTALSDMQDMTSDVCAASTVGDAVRLKDTRDGKYYWVAKFADNNCWMTQNLALDLTTEGLSKVDTDITEDWNGDSAYPPTTTTGLLDGLGEVASDQLYLLTRSWDFGDYLLAMPNLSEECNVTSTSGFDSEACVAAGFRNVASGYSPSADPDFFEKAVFIGTDGKTSCSKEANTAISTATSGVCAQYDAHYLVGSYYQWNAATAGTGGTLVSSTPADGNIANLTLGDLKDASGSICPKGWRLPTGGGTGGGTSNGKPFNQTYSFGALFSSYGYNGGPDTGGDNMTGDVIAVSPFRFVRGSYIGAGNEVAYPGRAGCYWSSTAGTQTRGAWSLFFSGNSTLGTDYQGSNAANRHSALSVRCVAR